MNMFIIPGMIGAWEIVIIILVLVLLFGGRKIPELMKGLGQGIKDFKKSMKDDNSSDKNSNQTKEEDRQV